MKMRDKPDRISGHARKEYPFTPRIVNPIRIKYVILFSADEEIRRSRNIIQAKMPWVRVRVLSDPLAASNVKSETVENWMNVYKERGKDSRGLAESL